MSKVYTIRLHRIRDFKISGFAKKNLNPQIPQSVILAKCYPYKMLLVKSLQHCFDVTEIGGVGQKIRLFSF